MKFEIDIDEIEAASIIYDWLIRNELSSANIKKAPSLFPKNPTPEILEQNRKEWEEYERSLEEYRKKLMEVFERVFKVKGEDLVNG